MGKGENFLILGIETDPCQKVIVIEKIKLKFKRLVWYKLGGKISWNTFANFAKCYREKFHKLASSFTG
jgi:hypothetical protein